jgi:hypothetical protein
VLNSTHPARQFNVNCQMRLVGPSVGNVGVTLSNPDGRLRFPNPANATVNLTLDAGGAFSAFTISGANASAAIGDAVIHIAVTAGGTEITTKKVTVVSFDQGSMQLAPGGNYNFVGAPATAVTYGPAGAAVSFDSSARIRPAGVDCTAPQLTNLRVAIMQQTSGMVYTTTWDTPTVAWAGAAQPTTVVPTTRRSSRVYDPAVTQPINDGFDLATDHAFPLYSKLAAALTPPSGCTGAGHATSSDSPNHPTSPTSQLPILDPATGATVGTLTWTRRINTTRVQHFKTFCVVFDSGPSQQFFSLREANWDINLDSAGAGPQHATVNADGPAATDPPLGVQANHVAQPETFSGVGGATTTFP